MARKKSYIDLDRQFGRIWESAVEQSDAYAAVKAQEPNAGRQQLFRFADAVLRGEGQRLGFNIQLTNKDRRINATIDKASQTAGRYRDNLRKKAGFSELTPYYATGERLKAYNEFTNKKYSRNTYMGLANG